VRAQARRRRGDLARRLRQLRGQPEQPHRADLLHPDLVQHAAMLDLRLRERALERQDVARRHVAVLSASTQYAVGFCFSFSSSSGVSALRFRLRSSRSAKRGSDFSDSTPTTSASASHCSCLLAAMLTCPSWVAKLPEGAAVSCRCPSAPALAADQQVGRHPAHQGQDRIEERDVDHLALAGPLAW